MAAGAVIGGVFGAAMSLFLYFYSDMPAALMLIPLGIALGAAQAYMMPE